jgi:S-(hydroxymethyl)glutathione dehydrogenase/alcohol dehydrogenase
MCLLGCGASTGIGAVFNTARVRPGESVVIYGCGGVGMSAVMGAKLAGAGQLIAVDVVDERLKMALELGADYVINASKENPQERVMALTGGADHAMECVGSTDIMTQAFASIHSRGKLTVIGVAPITEQLHIAPFEFLMGKTITGSRQGAMNWPIDMPRLVDLFMNGKLPLDKLITKNYALDEVNEAFEALSRGEGIRSIVRF